MAYATVDELAAALRIRVTAENTDSLQTCLDAAAMEIDHDIARDPEQAIPESRWLFDNQTAAGDPGAGYVRLNKSSTTAATSMFISEFDYDGTDWSGQTGATAGDVIQMFDEAATSDWVRFTLTGPAVDNTGWQSLPVDQTGASPTALQLTDGMILLLVFVRPTPLLGHAYALANRVNIVRGVEWFKAQDAAFGVIGSVDTGTLAAPRDGFNRHAYALSPLKQRWGLA